MRRTILWARKEKVDLKAQIQLNASDGATHLVIGRPIRAAQNPRIAAEKILAEMHTA